MSDKAVPDQTSPAPKIPSPPREREREREQSPMIFKLFRSPNACGKKEDNLGTLGEDQRVSDSPPSFSKHDQLHHSHSMVDILY